jgi:hypothetical protein
MVDEELVEIREGPNPSDAEETHRRAGPDSCHEPREVLTLCQTRPTTLGEPLEGARQNDARAADEIALTQHDVGSEILGDPARDECRNGRTQFVEEITQFIALLRVERSLSHAARV